MRITFLLLIGLNLNKIVDVQFIPELLYTIKFQF
jgi:hypothetical protein